MSVGRVALLLFVCAGPLGAQAAAARTPAQQADTARDTKEDWTVGMSVGVPGYRREAVLELFTLGVHWTQLRPGRLGGDVSLGVMPRALAAGAVVAGLRAGIALPVALAPGVLVLPSGGVSLLGGLVLGGAGGMAGYNTGLAVVLRPPGPDPLWLRVGVTWHRFDGLREVPWLVEFGFVRMPARPR